MIILEEATHVDFDFLGLSTSDPPLKRDRGRHEPDDNKDDTDAAMVKEDVFCQRLLLLGAKWWDSEARHRFVARVGAGEGPAVKDVEEGRVEEATLRERRWIKVAWEGATAAAPGAAGGSGGFWVLDYDTNMLGILEEENLVPEDAGKVGLARSMEERCEILKKMGARFFGAMVDYEGETTFLRAWESKWEGEVGGLVKVEW